MKILLRYLGYILLISIGFRIVPIIAGIIYGESVIPYVITAFISLILGFIFIWFSRRENANGTLLEVLSLPQAFMLAGIAFLLLPLISSISFLPSFHYNFINAFFESMSGFTTTGLTVYSSLESLPRNLLLWRAETQWIGGIGIVMIFLFIITRLQFYAKEERTQVISTLSLYEALGFSQKLEPSLKRSSKNVVVIYGIYTLLGIILLYFSGMSLFESISLAFTSISTGGFIVTNTLNINNLQLIILCVLMLLGSTSFIVHNMLFQGKFKEFILSYEKNIFLLFLLLGIGITFVVFTDVKVVIFQLISAFTTTGYAITKIAILPHLFIMMIVIGMMIGGSVASTSGGMKVARIYSLLAMIPWMTKKLISTRHVVIPLKIHKKVVEDKDLLIIVIFISLYFLILFAGTMIFLMLGYKFFDASFQMVSALGTVGLRTMNLIAVPVIGKIVLILAMLFGRLEIFPLLILMISLFKWFGNFSWKIFTNYPK
ncbi:MAG: potassium transporter TrkG [Gammaproteobacteria bacterium]|jgi:trk system potassium uptake protein TrkH